MIKRGISAIILLSVVLAIAHFISLQALVCLAAVILFAEIFHFSIIKQKLPLAFQVVFALTYVALASSLAFQLQANSKIASYLPVAIITAFWASGTFCLLKPSWLKQASLAKVNSIMSFATLALFYSLWPFFLVYQTLETPAGPLWAWGLVGICIVTDTFAYLAGKFFGKTSLGFLSPLSPNKTLVGALGGSFFGLLTTMGLLFYLAPDAPIFAWLLAGLVPFTAQAGDLLASLWKRAFDCKDASPLIPGHGGIFDRLDSFCFTYPLWYVIYQICLQNNL